MSQRFQPTNFGNGSHTSMLFRLIAWLLVVAVVTLGTVAWLAMYDWAFLPLSPYKVFPVLGILAFSIMWTHYIMASIQTYWSLQKLTLAHYFKWTGYAVLVLICLHPGLLMYQRFRDGYGLPPGSYETYVAPGLGWITLLGTASLLVFLAFEFRRFFGTRSWWHYVANASDIAMLAIAYHGLKLGSQLQMGWFKIVWWFYVVTLLAVLAYKYIPIITRTPSWRA